MGRRKKEDNGAPKSKYSEAMRAAALRYRQKSQHAISLAYRKKDYDEIVAPAAARAGVPVATFIKMAVLEKVERDKEKSNES